MGGGSSKTWRWSWNGGTSELGVNGVYSTPDGNSTDSWQPYWLAQYGILGGTAPSPLTTRDLSTRKFGAVPGTGNDIATKRATYLAPFIYTNIIPNNANNYISIAPVGGVSATGATATISANLYPALLTQKIALSYPYTNTLVKETPVKGVKYVQMRSTGPFTLSQLVIINDMGMNVAAGRAVWTTTSTTATPTLSTFGVDGQYIANSTNTYSLVVDLGTSYNISTISIYGYNNTTQTIIINMYNNSAVAVDLSAIPAPTMMPSAITILAQSVSNKSITLGATTTPVNLVSIYLSGTYHTSCQPQNQTIGTIGRYVSCSLTGKNTIITDTAGQILYTGAPNGNQIDLGEEHNIASIYVSGSGLDAATMSVQDALQAQTSSTYTLSGTTQSITLGTIAYPKSYALITLV